MVKAEKLSVGYGKKIILNDLNFNLEKGKIYTLIGPNGSGKSTVLKTLLRQINSCGGKVSILDKDLNSFKESQLALHVSMVMTERLHPEKMSCREVVATGRYPYTGKLGLLKAEDWNSVEEAISLVHADDVAGCDFTKISDGQRQRVMLARAICQDTEIIVLDEPTSFLDLYYKLDLLRTIHFLSRTKNKTIIMSLHELDLVKMISDFVLCVDGKNLVKAGSVDEIFSGNFIQSLYGLKDDEFNSETAGLSVVFEDEGLNYGMKSFGEDAAVNQRINSYGEDVALNQRMNSSGEDVALNQKTNSSKEDTSLPQKTNSSNEQKKAKVIMVQGTMSNAGKSLLVAGLCRVFHQDGFTAVPFKSQNMALNSFITKEGLEMGRAQVMQAEAAEVEPEVAMNPILLKPTTDSGSQVIVNGEVLGNMSARDYFKYKKSLIPQIIKAFRKLEEYADIIVIEGAGSPAEINLRENDIVNMGLAELVDCNVILAGDIDRGGVFAQLLGTVSLLSESEKNRIKGLVINKFRGDKTLLDSGIKMLEEKSGIPVCSVMPYLNINLEDEDSLSTRFDKKEAALINIGVIRLPKISNFTDFDVFSQFEEVAVHFISDPEKIHMMDMIIIPGSKNTISDLLWMRECGLEAKIKQFAQKKLVFGICGGYQMLGKIISDPTGQEAGGEIRGMELLDTKTVLATEKSRSQVYCDAGQIEGKLKNLSGKKIRGYEIHLGKTEAGSEMKKIAGGCYCGNVYGSYIHGFFDEGKIADLIVETLASEKGVKLTGRQMDYKAYKNQQFDILASAIRENMDMNAIYKMLKEENISQGIESE